MAEAEDVLVDAARHATVYARDLWRRRRPSAATPGGAALVDVARRLELLLAAAYGTTFALRVAQPAAPATLLATVFRRGEGPRVAGAVPATDGSSLWLPGALGDEAGFSAVEQYRVMALQQAVRALRGGASAWQAIAAPLHQAVFLVLNAVASDAQLCAGLPGVRDAVRKSRALALARRPALSSFPAPRRPLERFVREQLQAPVEASALRSVAECRDEAQRLADRLAAAGGPHRRAGRWLFRDAWTGEFRPTAPAASDPSGHAAQDPAGAPPRSARLSRRPDRREDPDAPDDRQGAWMVQTAQPHEHAEDPVGMQRPTDRDASTAAEELADSVSELPEARLVRTPGSPKEILLSDDPPPAQPGPPRGAATPVADQALQYPEWDCRLQAYRDRAVTVHVSTAPEGPQARVDAALAEHGALANLVRRRFEMLRPRREHLRRQLDGDEVDLEAWIEARADWQAGLPMAQTLYRSTRRARRDLAIVLLVDVSGSTDAWVSAARRVIDVEREALLLVAIAMQSMAEPNAILAFSGEGPHGVVVRVLKAFDDVFDAGVARRIASLEPEHYTRAGAAIRHATAVLMGQPARHRLLLMLSDGKPNDADDYGGRYGVEDLRRAVVETRLQGVQPFCLTVDRQAAGYLTQIFDPREYALLPQPHGLPEALLQWMRRLTRE